MKSLKFIAFIITFLTLAASISIADEGNSVFSKLKYHPDWSKIPSLNKIKNDFTLETGFSYKEGEVRCNHNCYLGFSPKSKEEEQCRIMCAKLHKNAFYQNYGTPMSCNRGDFAKSIIVDGSSWLLAKNYPKKTYDEWYYNSNSPLFLNYGFNEPVCYAFAEKHSFLTDKENFIKPKLIEEMSWDNNIAQIQLAKLEPSKIIEVDFNNDGKKELIYTTGFYYLKDYGQEVYDTYKGYTAFFTQNISAIKAYLKQPNLTLKNKSNFDAIVKKFNGKEINFAYAPFFSEKNQDWALPLIDLVFFEFHNKTYILSEKTNVFLIENNQAKRLCRFSLPDFELTSGYENLVCHVAANSYGLLVKNEKIKNYPSNVKTYPNYNWNAKNKNNGLVKAKKIVNKIPSDFDLNDVGQYHRIKKYNWDHKITQMQTPPIDDSLDGVILIDFNNDGQKELIHISKNYNLDAKENSISTRKAVIYYSNIDDIIKQLKQKSFVINNQNDFFNIAEKFNGKEITPSGTPYFDEKKERWFLPIDEPNFFYSDSKIYFLNKNRWQTQVFLIEKNSAKEICSFVGSTNIPQQGEDNIFCKNVASYYGFSVETNIINDFDNYISQNFKIEPYEWDNNIAQMLIEAANLSKIIELDFNNDNNNELIYTTGIYSLDGINNNIDTAIFSKNISEVKKYLKQPNLVLKNKDDFVKIAQKFNSDIFIHERFPIKNKNRHEELEQEIAWVYDAIDEPYGNIGYDIYLDDISLSNAFLKEPNSIVKNKDNFIRFVKKSNLKNSISEQFLNNKQPFNWNDFSFFKYNKTNYFFDTYYDDIYLIKDDKSHEICSFYPYLYKNENLPLNIIRLYTAKIISKNHVHEDSYLYDESFADEIKARVKNSNLSENTKKQLETYLKQKVKELCGTDLDKLEKTEESQTKVNNK
ncbi:MAG: hypothetical protein AB7U85_07425 [Alphaproteobacteria bacterium]